MANSLVIYSGLGPSSMPALHGVSALRIVGSFGLPDLWRSDFSHYGAFVGTVGAPAFTSDDYDRTRGSDWNNMPLLSQFHGRPVGVKDSPFNSNVHRNPSSGVDAWTTFNGPDVAEHFKNEGVSGRTYDSKYVRVQLNSNSIHTSLGALRDMVAEKLEIDPAQIWIETSDHGRVKGSSAGLLTSGTQAITQDPAYAMHGGYVCFPYSAMKPHAYAREVAELCTKIERSAVVFWDIVQGMVDPEGFGFSARHGNMQFEFLDPYVAKAFSEQLTKAVVDAGLSHNAVDFNFYPNNLESSKWLKLDADSFVHDDKFERLLDILIERRTQFTKAMKNAQNSHDYDHVRQGSPEPLEDVLSRIFTGNGAEATSRIHRNNITISYPVELHDRSLNSLMLELLNHHNVGIQKDGNRRTLDFSTCRLSDNEVQKLMDTTEKVLRQHERDQSKGTRSDY